MKIKMKGSGEVLAVPDSYGLRMVSMGYAHIAKEKPKQALMRTERKQRTKEKTEELKEASQDEPCEADT